MTLRQLLSLLFLAALLVGLSAYLAFSGPDDGLGGLAYPGDVEDVIPPSESTAPVQGGVALPVVRVEIVPVARLLQLSSPPRCRLLRGPSGDDEVPARALWLAGSAAVPNAGESPRGEQLVAFELDGGERIYRVVRLLGDEAEVEVRFEGPFSFAGRVLDGEGQPIEGARAWLAGRPEVQTDRDGRFRVDGLRSRSGLPLVLRAPGRADHFRVVAASGLAPGGMSGPDFHLQAGVDLGVRLAAALPDEGEATVYLRPRGGAGDGSLELRHFPFFWPALGDPPRLAADGSCLLSGLPKGESIEVVVQHPLLVTEPVAVDLRADRQNAVVQGRRGPVIRGRVSTAFGAPAAGTLVTCRRRNGELNPRGNHGFLLPASAVLAHVTHTFVAADGAFGVARGDAADPQWISVLPLTSLGLEREIRGGAEIRGASFALPAPGPLGDRPALRLLPRRAVRLIVVRGESTDPAVDLAAGTPYLLRLREPAVLDVTVRGPDGQRDHPGLAVPGVVDLEI